MKTKEEILEELFYKPETQDWYKPVLKAMETYAQQLRKPLVSGELPISCVNDFEKPEYCSQRNNHLCQKCKDW